MAEIEINGGRVVYEFVGPEDGELVVLTPGGRFSMNHAGVVPLAQALAGLGMRVLSWDRPNCGASDIQVYGRSESHMRAETLGLMLDKLGTGPVMVAGGSGGARDSILFTLRHPELVKKLALWSIVGGVYSSMNLASVYVIPELRAVRSSGIDGVAALAGPAGSWADLVAVNPRNRARLEAVGAEEFHRVMTRWLEAYVPKANEVIPGVSDWEFEAITAPTLIIRGGVNDFDHPKRTSIDVHTLIKSSTLVDPPWAEDAWEVASRRQSQGLGTSLDPWVLAAPMLVEFFEGHGQTGQDRPAARETLARARPLP